MAQQPVVDVVTSSAIESEALAAQVSRAEYELLGRLRRGEDRARTATTRALLRAVLAERLAVHPLDLAFTVRCAVCGDGAHGKPEPVLPPGAPPLHVSVSHAGGWCVVAVASTPVGIDVEACTGTAFAGFDDLALSTSEQRGLARLAADELADARTRLWVRKEALLKMHGVGLSVAPASLTVGIPTSAGRVLADPLRRGRPVALADVWLDAEHRACVCVAGDELPQLRLRDGRSLLAGQAAAP